MDILDRPLVKERGGPGDLRKAPRPEVTCQRMVQGVNPLTHPVPTYVSGHSNYEVEIISFVLI